VWQDVADQTRRLHLAADLRPDRPISGYGVVGTALTTPNDRRTTRHPHRR
jgi:hypothetical protein